jgi:tetratricopeptide (TPR) repeat protein
MEGRHPASINMSLLLEARKKAQSAEASRTASPEGRRPEAASAADEARQQAREAGQNLFGAKLPVAGHLQVNPYLLAALGATLLLLAAGAGYWWHLDSAGDIASPRPIATAQPIQLAAPTDAPAPKPIEAEPPVTVADEAVPVSSPAPEAKIEPPKQSPVRIAPQHTEAIDPLLRDAYAAYRNGNLDEARQSYLSMLAKDSRSTDALLGLAAIAQQRGENLMAAQYFARVLTLDPRNAVASAGMSALNTEDEGNESRLKMLLREQGESAALHFALGNLYAGQSRWSEAQQAYFNAWTLDADNAEFAYNLAVSLDHLGQAELATRYYRRAQQLDATHSAGFDHTQVARRIEALGQQGR